MSYFDAYNSTAPTDEPAPRRRSTPDTPLQAAIAAIIDDAATEAGGGNPTHESFNLAAMEHDIRDYAATMALYSDAPHEYINAVGADKIAARRGAYRHDNPAGLRIAHDEDLRREAHEDLRRAIFGKDYRPKNKQHPYPTTSESGGTWPSPQDQLMPGYRRPTHDYQA